MTGDPAHQDEFTFYIPGRVCLLGDKVDLKGYPVVTATVSRILRLDVRRVPRGADGARPVRLWSANFKSGLTFADAADVLRPETRATWAAHPLKYWAAVLAAVLGDGAHAARVDSGFEAALNSEIPIGKGVASSAALSVGLARALDALYGLDLAPDGLARLAYVAEHDVLQIPCGRMDQYAIATGGLAHIWTGEVPRVTALALPRAVGPLSVVVGDTLEPRPLQRLLVEFRAKLAAHDALTEEVFDRIKDCVEAGRDALVAGGIARGGDIMRAQMAQERRVGCITPGLERLCAAAERAGAVGAKLTGIGGGGCMVALCTPATAPAVARAITDAGGQPFVVDVVNLVSATGALTDHVPHIDPAHPPAEF